VGLGVKSAVAEEQETQVELRGLVKSVDQGRGQSEREREKEREQTHIKLQTCSVQVDHIVCEVCVCVCVVCKGRDVFSGYYTHTHTHTHIKAAEKGGGGQGGEGQGERGREVGGGFVQRVYCRRLYSTGFFKLLLLLSVHRGRPGAQQGIGLCLAGRLGDHGGPRGACTQKESDFLLLDHCCRELTRD